MPFPHSTQGVVSVEAKTSADFCRTVAGVEAVIREAKPSRLSRTAETIRFECNLFRFVSRFNELCGISHGEITISHDEDRALIHYKIWFRQLVAGTIVFSVLFLSIFTLSRDLPAAIISTCAPWLCHAFNYAVKYFSFPQFLRFAISRKTRNIVEPTS